MKKRLIALMLFVMVMFSPVLSYAENLLKNSDFSDTNGEEIAFWQREKINETYYSIGVEDNTLFIDNNITNYSKIGQKVDIKPNKYYKITGKIKVEKAFNSGAYLMVNIYDEGRYEKSRTVTSDEDGWQEVEMYGKTEDSQYSINIYLCLGENENRTLGKAYFKDLKMEELDGKPKGEYSLWYLGEMDYKVKDITINLVAKLLFFGIVLAIAWCIYKNFNVEQTEEIKKRRLDKKDIAIMSAITLIYAAVAFYNLGYKTFPKTGWLGEKEGEYVVIEIPKMTQIGKITYCEGLNDKIGATGKVKLEYLDGNFVSDEKVSRYHIFQVYSYDSFMWNELREDVTTSRIKIETLEPGMDIREIAFYEKGSKTPIKGLKIVEDTTKNKVGKNIIDEQEYAQYEMTNKNGAYFDEVLYSRTGYEYFNNLEGFEKTHPPLGKILFGIGIKLFGMNPFGWRIMGTLFGIAMVPIMYLFANKLFKERLYAILAAILISVDCMHFVQTRTCLIDSYSLVFIMLMYYYMADIFNGNDKKVTTKYVKALALSGLFWSLGAATKWLVVYGGVGLAILYFMSLYKNMRENKKEVIKSMALATVFFVILPLIVYLLVYIPVLRPTKEGYTILGVFEQIKNMFVFHANEEMAHFYKTYWYEWFLMLVPMIFYAKFYPGGKISRIVTVGNPLIWWTSVIAVAMTAYIAYKKKDNKVWIFIIAYISQYFPWIFIKRTLFIYHYFSVIPFAILAIVYMLNNLNWNKKKNIALYMTLTIAIFMIYYPDLSALKIPSGYFNVIKITTMCAVFWIAHLLNVVLKMVL